MAGLAAASALAFEVPAKLAIETVRVDRTAYEPGSQVLLEVAARIDDGWHVNSNTPTYDFLIPTTLELGLPADWPNPSLEWPPAKEQSFSFAEVPLSVFDGRFIARARVDIPATAASGSITVPLTLAYQACDDKSCLQPTEARGSIEIVVGSGGVETQPLETASVPGSASPGRATTSLLAMIAFGVLGGLILNLMPCVLPVLSLKVFALVRAAGQGRSEVRRGALATSFGIVVSFLALAVVAVGFREAGAAVGWGVQFQQPSFLVFLAVVIVLFALNLWGVFEITLPGALADAADAGSAREGLAGHFASGLFATLMATPCSAPFLGTAVSFALGQPASSTLVVFGAVGIGMALPYLLLAASPGAARWLPKPGAWMETLKGVMGFLLAAAGVWVLYVLGSLVSAESLALVQAGLLLLALAVWLRSRAHRPTARWVWFAVAAVTAVGAIAGVTPDTSRPSLETAGATGGISWTPFDEATALGLAAEGRLVFVDVTADWCLTCKVNEKLILAQPEVAAAFETHAVVAMKADWTRRDDTIAAYLQQFGRSGIPFYVLYRPDGNHHVFGEVLTVGAVLEALTDAANR